MRVGLPLTLLVVGMDLAAVPPPSASVAAASAVACRALEVHADATLGVTVVVFHQRDDADRERVGALLRAHDGAVVEFQTRDGAWHAATAMRLKSCFGRGLLLFRAGAAALVEKDEFLLREPAGGAQ